MFVLAGCGYVIVQGQTLYGGMIYRPLYEVCPCYSSRFTYSIGLIEQNNK